MFSQNIFSLHDAVKEEDINAVRYYINKGVDINELSNSISALMLALMNNNIEIVKILINNGATILNETYGGEIITLIDFVKSLGYSDVEEYINFLSEPSTRFNKAASQ